MYKKRSPAFPEGASPLYTLLVPFNNPHGVDEGMVVGMDPLHCPTPPGGIRPCRKYYRQLQWIIDVLQLCQTCKHANHWIEHTKLSTIVARYQPVYLDANVLHSLFIKPRHAMIARAVGMPADRPARALPVAHAIFAAFLDRIGVAKELCPQSLQVNWHAIRALSPYVPPSRSKSHVFPCADTPFMFAVGEFYSRRTDTARWRMVATSLRPALLGDVHGDLSSNSDSSSSDSESDSRPVDLELALNSNISIGIDSDSE